MSPQGGGRVSGGYATTLPLNIALSDNMPSLSGCELLANLRIVATLAIIPPMQTVTAKEAKNRLGQVINMALSNKVVAISKNGRDSVVLVSAEYFRELTGKQGFLNDSHAAEKNKRRKEFSSNVKHGHAKSTDASMFKGMKTTVKFRNEEF